MVVLPLLEKLAATLLAVGRAPTVLLAGQPLPVAAAAGPAVPAMANRVVLTVTVARLIASTRMLRNVLKPMFLFPPFRFLCPALGMRQAAREQIRPPFLRIQAGGHLRQPQARSPDRSAPGSAADRQPIRPGTKVTFLQPLPKVRG